MRPLPDGDQSLGFIFADAATPGEVEKALTTASQRLRVAIDKPARTCARHRLAERLLDRTVAESQVTWVYLAELDP